MRVRLFGLVAFAALFAIKVFAFNHARAVADPTPFYSVAIACSLGFLAVRLHMNHRLRIERSKSEARKDL